MKRTDSEASSTPEAARHSKVRYVNWWKGSIFKAPEERRPRRIKGWVIPAAAGVLVTIGAGTYVAYSQMKPVLTTSADESRTKRLRDGVEIKLGANSQASFDPKEGEHCLNLDKGQVDVIAAMDPNRTFAIQTRLGRATTVGATFRVTLGSSMLVEVFDGAVDVEVIGAPTVTVKEGLRYYVNPRRATVDYERGHAKSAMTARRPANRSA